MIFKRTSSGLKNQHVFYKVDYVVFLEGGKSFSRSEVDNNMFSVDTEDILYWQRIFSEFASSMSFKFKSIGSKEVLLALAEELQQNNLKSMLIAMDAEFDEVLGKKVQHPQVFYTYGYSWENDIWNGQSLKRVIELLTANTIDSNDVEQEFENKIQKLKIGVYADLYLFKNSDSFFERKKGIMFCIECQPDFLPFVKPEVIAKRIQEKGLNRFTLYKHGRPIRTQISRYCYGHLLADFCCLFINRYLKKMHSLSSISNNALYRIGISQYFTHVFHQSPVYLHHKAQFLRTF